MKRNPKFDVVEKIPQWAVCYYVNGDDSGLTEEDRDMADAYAEKLAAKGMRLVCPVDGSESEFEPYPAFGLACGTVDFTVELG